MSGPLDLTFRRRLYALIQAYPGLHLREAARQLETSVALIEYHVAILRANGLVAESRDDRFVRLFAVDAQGTGPTEEERQSLALLRGRLPLRILLYLLDQDAPVQHKVLAERLELGKSKLSFHLRKLESRGLVEKTGEGHFQAANRQRLLRLLLEFQPTPDLRAEFEEVWESLYG